MQGEAQGKVNPREREDARVDRKRPEVERDRESGRRGSERVDILTAGTIDKEENHPIVCIARAYAHSTVISPCFIPSDCELTYSQYIGESRVKIIAEERLKFENSIALPLLAYKNSTCLAAFAISVAHV